LEKLSFAALSPLVLETAALGTEAPWTATLAYASAGTDPNIGRKRLLRRIEQIDRGKDAYAGENLGGTV
jgi:hypothetical protein